MKFVGLSIVQLDNDENSLSVCEGANVLEKNAAITQKHLSCTGITKGKITLEDYPVKYR